MAMIYKVAEATKAFHDANIHDLMSNRNQGFSCGRLAETTHHAKASKYLDKSWTELSILGTGGLAGSAQLIGEFAMVPLAAYAGVRIPDQLAEGTIYACQLWSETGAKNAAKLYEAHSTSSLTRLEHEGTVHDRETNMSDQQFTRRQQEMQETLTAGQRALESLAQAFKTR